MGKPPVYDRAGLNLSDEDKARMRAKAREGYWRFLLNRPASNGPMVFWGRSLSMPHRSVTRC